VFVQTGIADSAALSSATSALLSAAVRP